VTFCGIGWGADKNGQNVMYFMDGSFSFTLKLKYE